MRRPREEPCGARVSLTARPLPPPPNRASKARAAGRTIPRRDVGGARGGGDSRFVRAAPPSRAVTPSAAGRRPPPFRRRYLRCSSRFRTVPGCGIRAGLSPPTLRKAMDSPATTEAGSGDTRTRPAANRRREGEGGEGSAPPSGHAPGGAEATPPLPRPRPPREDRDGPLREAEGREPRAARAEGAIRFLTGFGAKTVSTTCILTSNSLINILNAT